MRKLALVVLVACSSSSSTSSDSTPTPPPAQITPSGRCSAPAEAQLEDVSTPTTVVGTGTPESCTSEAFVSAVKNGGVITFACGDAPTTIVLSETAKVFNDKGPKIVIDGGNKITLSGGGKNRILYMNTCDKNQVWTSSDCNNQPDPQLTVQNIAFVDGNAKGLEKGDNEGGGGAIYARGGRVKILNSHFSKNVCDDAGSDVGGGAIRVLQNYEAGDSPKKPVYIATSTFEANACANGGALSSIGTSYTIMDSSFTGNQATGHGASSGEGGNGGAVYNDGNTYDLHVCGTTMEGNHANEGGSAVFYVSNDQSGSIYLDKSTFKNNPKGTFETKGFPGFFIKAKGDPNVTDSTFE